jgi:hypothetical protein
MPWVWNQGPFPRPALPGVLGTTGLSATPLGPSCPSRESGWRPRAATEGVSRVALDLRLQTCRLLYPGGTTGSDHSWDGLFHPFPCSPAATAFPETSTGRLPRQKFRGLIGSSLALRPACSRDRQSGPLHRRLRRLRYLHRRSDCYRRERSSCRAGITPAEDPSLSTAHNVPFDFFRACSSRWEVSTRRSQSRLAEAWKKRSQLAKPGDGPSGRVLRGMARRGVDEREVPERESLGWGSANRLFSAVDEIEPSLRAISTLVRRRSFGNILDIKSNCHCVRWIKPGDFGAKRGENVAETREKQ